MLFFHRARAQQRPFACIATSALVAMFFTPWGPVFASSPEDDQQRVWLPSAPVEAFAGEITYEFDSASNKTTATYVAPLGSRSLLHHVFFGAPTVHTITVSYQFAGRISSHVPDTVRMVLDADEYIDAALADRFPLENEPIITFGIGGHAVQHSLSVSQRIEVEAGSSAQSGSVVMRGGYQQPAQLPQIDRAHVRLKATSWLAGCEFLSMIDEREIRGTVAGVDFTLNHEVVTGLKVLAAEMLPDSGQQRSIDCTAK